MAGQHFPISTNKSEFCFRPMTCATETGHLVIWAHGVGGDKSSLWCCLCTGKEAIQDAIKIGELSNNDGVLFLRRFRDKMYLLAIESVKSTIIYFLDDHGNVCDRVGNGFTG